MGQISPLATNLSFPASSRSKAACLVVADPEKLQLQNRHLAKPPIRPGSIVRKPAKTGFFRPVLAKSVLVKNRTCCKLVSNQGGRPVVGHLLYVVVSVLCLFCLFCLLFVVKAIKELDRK